MIRSLLIAVLLLLPTAVSASEEGADVPAGQEVESAPALKSSDCLDCHGEKDLEPETERGKTLTLFVDKKALDGSVHQDLECTDCHGGAKTFEDAPHNGGAPLKLLCADCHSEVVDEYQKSIHGIWHEKGDEEAATCSNCHGTHDILPSSNLASRTNKFNLHKTCAVCHEGKAVLETHKMEYPDAVAHFVDSIHGKALLVDGLIVAPSCNDCHGVHDILPHTHPNAHISRNEVPKTCGRCHVLVESVYEKSVHGRLLASHNARGPVCTTCHPSHQKDEPSAPEFRLKADRICGECHQKQLVGYRDTFHGKAMALGRQEVAACFDCHGHHDIQEIDNPESHISAKNRLETCRKCHPNAPPNFAEFQVHADHTNKERDPQLYYVFWAMTALLIGTFGFFAVHSVLWLLRTMALFTSDSKDFREQKKKAREDHEAFVRFRPLDRFLHGLIITSFLLLVVTGMPLKFFYTDWAKFFFHIMGGQAVAAILHRVGALITGFYFGVHVIDVLHRFFKGRARFRNPDTGRFELRRMLGVIFGPDSPMPTLQDLRDMIAHNRWFFGKGEKPQFDRWTYWEKFDYMAVFWGVAIIGTSGLIMWFPESFTTFLPGKIINVALIVHSDEALLAAGFIFTFHFFNVHFRPEKFPMDPVIFSGRITRTELEQERKRLLDRWSAEGRLDENRVHDEWDSWKWIAMPAGFLAFCLGVTLVVLIFYAMVTRLLAG